MKSVQALLKPPTLTCTVQCRYVGGEALMLIDVLSCCNFGVFEVKLGLGSTGGTGGVFLSI